jgi:cytochrome bd-type quinol oxidase subunit 2
VNPEFLSRLQFALTASFHFIFPPISMGLGLLMVWMAWKYVRTGDPVWRQASLFWTKVYGLVFALGIATGVVQEFAFGMNWSQYSRFVGNVFGSLLAAEGVFAFFLEGGFLGLMLFGGERLGPRMWLLATSLVVFGAHFSALWILMANLQARVRRWIPRLVGLFALFGAVAALWIAVSEYGVTDTYTDDIWPIVFPLVALAAFVVMVIMVRRGRDAAAFFSSSAMLAFLLATVPAGLYPNMLKSSTDPTFSMTVTNASAASNTLTVMLIMAIIGIPFVLLYTAGVQYIFRGKVKLTASSY